MFVVESLIQGNSWYVYPQRQNNGVTHLYNAKYKFGKTHNNFIYLEIYSCLPRIRVRKRPQALPFWQTRFTAQRWPTPTVNTQQKIDLSTTTTNNKELDVNSKFDSTDIAEDRIVWMEMTNCNWDYSKQDCITPA